MDPERRRVPRYPFIASAEVTEAMTETVVRARTSELSRYGCYLDMMNPLPMGTSVRIAITHEEKIFKAAGKVIYDQQNMGMGVAFTAIADQHLEILENWLRELWNR